MFNKAETYLRNHPIGISFDPYEFQKLVKDDCEANATYALWKFREEESGKFKSTYAMCNPLFETIKKAILK